MSQLVNPGGAVASVSAADSSLTITPTTGAVTAKINLSAQNTWLVQQVFNGNGAAVTLGGASYDLQSGHSFFSLNNQIIELAEGSGIAAGQFTDLTNNLSAYFALPTMAASFSAYGGGVNIGTSSYQIDAFGIIRGNKLQLDDRLGFGDIATIYTDFAYAAGEIYFKAGGTNVGFMIGPNQGCIVGGFQSQQVPAQGLVVVGATGLGLQGPTAWCDVTAATTAKASIRIRSGTAPTSPNDGDMWYDGTNLKFRVGATTKTVI